MGAQAEHSDSSLALVGVGASAGGLEAFSELLKHLPPATGMAFVLIQHLDPHHQSVLPELLAAKTSMPVVQVQSDTPIRHDHVYVISPNTLILVRRRSLIPQVRPAESEKFRPIDSFFESLAEEFHSNAIGVVLSGTASDGTLGLKAIKAEGGITFAQNETAKFDGMPRSAIAAGVVDFVLSPRRIAEELVAIASPALKIHLVEKDLATDSSTLRRLLLALRNQSGVDFSQYKLPTILRRLNRRILVRRSPNLEEYLELLEKEPGEGKALFDDLLISVTDFFRDPEVFESARAGAFPLIIKNRKPPHNLRVWIPACSTGEEVYSMAIELVEFLETQDRDWSLQMFGTDLSDLAIAKARAGIYDAGSVANLTAERLRRFFVRTDSGYQINRTIREMCIFSRHNVASDPPLSRMDLISCRNLLIYFAPSLQRRIISIFGYALQPGGCLILGKSESLGTLADYFLAIDEPHKIYFRKGHIPQEALGSPEIERDQFVAPFAPWERAIAATPTPVDMNHLPDSVHEYVNRIVLSRYSPAGLVIDQSLRITQHRGDVRRYLATGETDPTADLMTSVRTELRVPLSSALEEARRTNTAVVADHILPSDPESSLPVSITVVPMSLEGTSQQFLILFHRSKGEVDSLGVSPTEGQTVAPATAVPLEQENGDLRQELKSTREYLQSVIEELRSTNEEAQSANEELQSTNEEVQTSKEELQSANEELNTINAELQSRNSDLARLNDDLINLLGSMNMPVVMTGNDLRIRRFTPMAEKVFRLISTDIGRPIADLKPRINVPDLEGILQRVVESLQPHEQEVHDQEGRLYLMRVRPYRTADNRIDGTVLQLLDVTELKISLEEVRRARDYAEAIVNTVRQPLVVLDQTLVIQNANSAFFEALGINAAAAQKRTIYEVARGHFDGPEVQAMLRNLDGELNDFEFSYQADSGDIRICLLNARRLEGTDRRHLILLAFEDITERKRASEARYRRLFESARDGILLVDADTVEILDLNPFTERLLGYARSDLVGRKFWDIEPMKNSPKLRATIEQIRDQGVLRLDDLVIRTREGQDIQTEVIANVYSEGDRRAIQFNIRDVSERKKFERELLETQKLEGLGLLAGGIAHDFNNLLTGILGNASLAYLELPSDQTARLRLREITRTAERAGFLTRQMLAYAGKGKFTIETIDLGDLVREISTLVRTSIPKTVELRLDLPRDLPPIQADPAQIHQVIMNLVINAAEAIGEHNIGKVEVRTRVRQLSQNETAEFFPAEQALSENYVQLEVTDTGSGMDEATKARIFDPFFTTKFTGRGLGLAAVQGIVKGHKGAIRVYSTPGHGTTFLVLLPAQSNRAAPILPEQQDVLSVPPGSIALVIDDEAVVRNVAINVLNRMGMKVLTAENGSLGVALFREHHRLVSVVLLDLMMPVMRGEEAFAQIREIDSTVPVILSSGFGETEAERRFAALKPARFLQKPYTADRLIEMIAATLNSRKA